MSFNTDFSADLSKIEGNRCHQENRLVCILGFTGMDMFLPVLNIYQF